MTSDRAPHDQPPPASGWLDWWRPLWPVLVLISWLCTPVLTLHYLTSGSWGNSELPTESEARRSAWLYFAVLTNAFAVPLVAAIVAAFQRRRLIAWLFAAALLTSCAAGTVTGLVTVERVRHAEETLWPDDPTPWPTWTRTPCQEYSGGDTTCPGG